MLRTLLLLTAPLLPLIAHPGHPHVGLGHHASPASIALVLAAGAVIAALVASPRLRRGVLRLFRR